MTLNLPKLYCFWFVGYCQTRPAWKKKKSPNLWPITSILVYCLFSLNCNSQNRMFRPLLKTSLAKQASYRAQNGGLVASCQIILWHVFLWIEEPTFKHSLLTWLLFTKSPTYLYNIKIQSFSNQIPFNFTSFGRS